jgi:hypothetical protein
VRRRGGGCLCETGGANRRGGLRAGALGTALNAVTPSPSVSPSVATAAAAAAGAGTAGTRPEIMATGKLDVGGTVLPAVGKAAPDFTSSGDFVELLFFDDLLPASFSAPANVLAAPLSLLELTEEPPDCAWDVEATAEVEGPAATGVDT